MCVSLLPYRAPASGTSHGSVQVSTVDDLLDFNASGPPGPPAQQEPPLDGNLEAPNAAPNPYTQPVPGYALPPQGTMASPYIGQPGYAYPPMQGAPVGGPQSVAAAAAPQLAMPSQGQYSVPVPQPLQAAGNPPPVQVDSAMSDQQAQQGMSPAAPAPVGEASDTVPDRAAAEPDSSHSEVAIGKQASDDATGQQEKAGDSIGSVSQFAEDAHNTQTQGDAADSNAVRLGVRMWRSTVRFHVSRNFHLTRSPNNDSSVRGPFQLINGVHRRVTETFLLSVFIRGMRCVGNMDDQYSVSRSIKSCRPRRQWYSNVVCVARTLVRHSLVNVEWPRRPSRPMPISLRPLLLIIIIIIIISGAKSKGPVARDVLCIISKHATSKL